MPLTLMFRQLKADLRSRLEVSADSAAGTGRKRRAAVAAQASEDSRPAAVAGR
jgi:hypothetical protein